MNFISFDITENSALFLDRDGVINKRMVGDYVRNLTQFEIIDGSIEAIIEFSKYFKYIFVVTNQQGIGKGLFKTEDLTIIHNHLIDLIQKNGGFINQIYFCPHLVNDECSCRKPNIGMALKAKKDFEQIDLKSSLMIGDSLSDMEFGNNAGMSCIFIGSKKIENTLYTAISLKEISKCIKFNII
jgi:D-glycero-D-manno-heptose 1,7-bisphosphate phosphatase